MSWFVFFIVICAALLHAGWNAMVKGGADKSASMMAVVLGQGLAGAVLLMFVPMPAAASLPYLAGGLVLHVGYQVFLVSAYKIGDLTQVYPIARGVSPLLVAAVSVIVLGERFSHMELAAVALIALGIASISLTRRAGSVFQGKAAGLALITGGFIAGYSMVDGMGARVAGTALGFYAWESVLNVAVFAMGARVLRPGLLGRALVLRKSLFIGGGASFAAYALVMWSFTQAPIALVTALRETSIIFALLIGVGMLGERVTLMKLVSVTAALCGVVLLRLAQS